MTGLQTVFGCLVRPGSAIMMTLTILLPVSLPALAQDNLVTAETLLDRIQIEDLLARYYVELAAGESHSLAAYFAEDAVLDVNGTIARGHEEIAEMYGAGEEADVEPEADRQGRGHMLLTNPVIRVDGDTATAWVIWTGVMNDDVREPPRLYEQGREYSELEKRDGRWLITHRYISADSGLPERWEETYRPREHR